MGATQAKTTQQEATTDPVIFSNVYMKRTMLVVMRVGCDVVLQISTSEAQTKWIQPTGH
jgi:hypothetical protein